MNMVIIVTLCLLVNALYVIRQRRLTRLAQAKLEIARRDFEMETLVLAREKRCFTMLRAVLRKASAGM